MKILIVGGMFPPMRTGTAFYTQNLAFSLQKNGHDIEIVSLGTPAVEEVDGIQIHRLTALNVPLAGFFKHLRLCAWNPFNWWRLFTIAKESKADVIVLVNHYLDIAFPAIFAAKLNKVPLVCSVGTQLQSLNPLRNKVLNLLDSLICGSMLFPNCDRIIAWDTQIQQYLQDIHGEKILRKISIVNYGVNGNASELISSKHNYNKDDIILGVGAVSEQRSFVPLVRAFAQLAPQFPSLKLRIIGHIYYDAAQILAKKLELNDRVEFLGEKSHDEVINYMQDSTVFYSSLTGKYVGLGTATIEAMLLGLPTVVNTPLNLLGTGTLEDKRHLIQCTSSNHMDIAESLKPLILDQELREKVGQGGKEFVQKYLNWEVVSQDMSSVLKQTIEGYK